MNSELAEKTSLLALKVGAELNKHLHEIKNECSSEEFFAFRESTAKIMGELQFGFMNPIYEEHPDLKPRELGGEYDINPAIYT